MPYRKPRQLLNNYMSQEVCILVRLVDIIDCDDGEVTVIPEVTESNPGAGLEGQLVNLLLRDVESDGDGEEDAVLQTDVLHNSVQPCQLMPLKLNGRRE